MGKRYGEKAIMTTKEEGSQQKGMDRRRFAASTGALLGMLSIGEPASSRVRTRPRRRAPLARSRPGVGISPQSVT